MRILFLTAVLVVGGASSAHAQLSISFGRYEAPPVYIVQAPVYAPAPVQYVQPPVQYVQVAPPPAYYAPPPVVYARPACQPVFSTPFISLSFGRSYYGNGYGYGHHHHHYGGHNYNYHRRR